MTEKSVFKIGIGPVFVHQLKIADPGGNLPGGVRDGHFADIDQVRRAKVVAFERPDSDRAQPLIRFHAVGIEEKERTREYRQGNGTSLRDFWEEMLFDPTR